MVFLLPELNFKTKLTVILVRKDLKCKLDVMCPSPQFLRKHEPRSSSTLKLFAFIIPCYFTGYLTKSLTQDRSKVVPHGQDPQLLYTKNRERETLTR